MNEEDRAIIRYRLELARDDLDAAEILVENEKWRACTNRLYYACFYAVCALLKSHGMQSAKHSGVRSLFNRHFVHPGVISADSGELFNLLFDRRQKLDYEDLAPVEADKIRPLVELSKRLLDEVERVTEDTISPRDT